MDINEYAINASIAECEQHSRKKANDKTSSGKEEKREPKRDPDKPESRE